MSSPKLQLSDRHNFGKTVERLPNGKLLKPRSIFWEKLLLTENPIRQKIFSALGVPSTLPSLEVEILGPWQGSVTELRLSKPTFITPANAALIGTNLGIFTWLGLTDLHFENILWGNDASGTFQFTTVDIETAFEEPETLGHTSLVPDISIPLRSAGLFDFITSKVLEASPESCIAEICGAYLSTLNKLETKRLDIEEAFAQAALEAIAPIRVIFRKTLSYHNYMIGKVVPLEFAVPAFPSELEQMNRGDIPYYFRLPSEPDQIFYFDSPSTTKQAGFSNEFIFEEMMKRRRITAKGIEATQGQTMLLKVGSLQLARCLVRAALPEGKSSTSSLCKITHRAGKIYLRYGTDLKLSCDLD